MISAFVLPSICALQKAPPCFFWSAQELHDSTYDRVAQYGVFTLPKPISKQTFLQALAWMASTRERLRRFEKSTLTIEEKMEEIRLVNRAKWLLISELHMDEPQAHRYIEKQAMRPLCFQKNCRRRNCQNLFLADRIRTASRPMVLNVLSNVQIDQKKGTAYSNAS